MLIFTIANDRAFFDYQSAGRDVTEQKLAEDALQESEARMSEAVGLAKLGTWVWDSVGGRGTYYSEEHARIHGLSVEQCIEISNTLGGLLSMFHPDDRKRVGAAFQELHKGTAYEMEYRVVTPDGEVRHV
jgi:PAS domain-containing protein